MKDASGISRPVETAGKTVSARVNGALHARLVSVLQAMGPMRRSDIGRVINEGIAEKLTRMEAKVTAGKLKLRAGRRVK